MTVSRNYIILYFYFFSLHIKENISNKVDVWYFDYSSISISSCCREIRYLLLITTQYKRKTNNNSLNWIYDKTSRFLFVSMQEGPNIDFKSQMQNSLLRFFWSFNQGLNRNRKYQMRVITIKWKLMLLVAIRAN